jgi:protein-tyrosine phosphatase
LSDDIKKPAGPNPSGSKMVVDFASVRRASGRNFRDLGGHHTSDGRVVRQRMIYRSAHLAEIPEQSPLRDIQLRTLITLQSRIEVSVLGPPNPQLFKSVRWEHIPMGDRWFSEGPPKPPPGHEHLILLNHFRDDWRTFFKLAADQEIYPLLFHCSAGRDRTGVAAALLLELLGVMRERIVADFLESNHAFPDIPLLASQLEPLFATIDEEGGIRPFMRNLGLDDAEIDSIRSHLLAEQDSLDSNGTAAG